MAGSEIALGIEQREGAFLAGKLDAGPVGGGLDRRHPGRGLLRCRGAAIMQAAHGERIGKAGDAEADAALAAGLLGLARQRIG